MKDYLHLFGGMGAAILALAIYIFAFGAAMRCFGATCYVPQSGDEALINDTSYILVSKEDWRRWTNAVARLEAVAERRWANEHKTDAGRRAWHGALKEKRQTEDGRGIVYTYADGFEYTEQAEPVRRVPHAVQRQTEALKKTAPAVPAGLPPKLAEKRKEIAERPAAKEVNATFGPGGKLIRTEGAK